MLSVVITFLRFYVCHVNVNVNLYTAHHRKKMTPLMRKNNITAQLCMQSILFLLLHRNSCYFVSTFWAEIHSWTQPGTFLSQISWFRPT